MGRQWQRWPPSSTKRGAARPALLAGIAGVWLRTFLFPQRAQPAYVTLAGVHFYPERDGELPYRDKADPRLAQPQPGRLGRRDEGGDGRKEQ